MPVENTVSNSGLTLATQLSSSDDWNWTVVALGFMMLAFTLGKLCIRHSTDSNGRVQTTVVLPKLLSKFSNIGRYRQRNRHNHSVNPKFTQQQRQWYAQLYSGQEIVFGIVLYIAGLAVMTQTGMQLFSDAGYANIIVPFLLFTTGAFVAIWGILAVLRRNKHNPFMCSEPL